MARARSNHLFPVKALSRHFRGRMVSALRRAATQGDLHRVTRSGEVDAVLNSLMAKDWVVYTKACLHYADTVVKYLARYTYRIAITNARLLDVDSKQVTFRIKDYRNNNRHKTVSLDGQTFVQRFLLHVLPKGLMRVRHYGFLANRCRRKKLVRIRHALAAPPPVSDSDAVTRTATEHVCPRCQKGRLTVVAVLAPCGHIWVAPG